MPVFVVEDADTGVRGFCNMYEGESRKRLNYGVFDDEVRAGLDFLRDGLAPVLADAVRRLGGVPLTPLISRALRMGDELHSRNTAATTLFLKHITPALLDMAADGAAPRRPHRLRLPRRQRLLVPAAVDGGGEGRPRTAPATSRTRAWSPR